MSPPQPLRRQLNSDTRHHESTPPHTIAPRKNLARLPIGLAPATPYPLPHDHSPGWSATPVDNK
ncbi:hypothetical protein ACGE24_00715 [Corynebacterium kroppenstedtii]|uniref:hypothetical protein n=1 Tax=Corynebacterium sp. PCR 32 TaxID=3351342 RepID=UPI0030B5846F